ncbi:helix-turn-helix domain-containing protein [Mycoplana rhizolycopersici]|uniref:Helix-turn-helix domain-containing protein n=1 Tax=Mycoplana rhizolycopersici TaxID=2746702 RepID=A0ABX2QBI8_9HYPH|nr:helix-turn-helix domain-containing protein [Rhizobium rhizolycopersici]NVP55104.1 helix-turn-helix domain-containing protein [Rhizobium rhizolycopersici]
MQQQIQLPEIAITAGAAQGRASFEVFEYACAPVFDAWMTDQAENGTFDLQFHSAQIGRMILGLAGMTGAHYRYERNERKVAQTGLELVLVQMITEGSDVRIVDGREIVSRPGDIFISDLTRTIATTVQHCRNVTIAVPRTLISDSEADLDRLHDRVLQADTTAARLFASHLATTWRERHSIAAGETEMVAQATAQLLASLALSNAGREDVQRSISASVIVRVCRYIDDNLGRADLGPDLICREMGLSRAALYRLFEPLEGVARHIRNRRLVRVFRALTSRRAEVRTIAEIAYAHGFFDMSAFIRAFKARYGMTPSDARTMAAMLPPEPAANGIGEGGSLLRHWITAIGTT